MTNNGYQQVSYIEELYFKGYLAEKEPNTIEYILFHI